MTRKRTELEIFLEILRTVESGVNRPTNIMYKCNLAWKPFKEFLNSLVEHDIVRVVEEGNRRNYELTEEGYKVLGDFGKVDALLASLRSREMSG